MLSVPSVSRSALFVLVASSVVLLNAFVSNCFGQENASEKKRGSQRAEETIAFFDSGAIPELKLKIDEDDAQQLREAPREYVRCAFIENGTSEFKSVAVKLKGAAGSYRDFDDRPGLTLNVGKYKKSQRFHGMQKFHLNNSVQDESFVCEWLGAEIFRQAGYPAPRVGHVRLWINDRDMGLYVLREGFDEGFLQRSFGRTDGNLYDGGFLQDIDSELEMDSGDDPDAREDIVGLALAGYCPIRYSASKEFQSDWRWISS